MKTKADRTAVPYSYLIDNIKVILIFLVVFNHIIAFQLVKTEEVIRYIWYAITIFHMPAFVFISGYLSKKPQNVLKNVKNLLILYNILGIAKLAYPYFLFIKTDTFAHNYIYLSFLFYFCFHMFLHLLRFDNLICLTHHIFFHI